MDPGKGCREAADSHCTNRAKEAVFGEYIFFPFVKEWCIIKGRKLQEVRNYGLSESVSGMGI